MICIGHPRPDFDVRERESAGQAKQRDRQANRHKQTPQTGKQASRRRRAAALIINDNKQIIINGK